MKIPVSQPVIGEEEKKFVNDALNKGELSGFSGNYITDFETGFARYCGVEHAVTVSNGTTALHLALAALKIGAGDDVLVQSFTNMATFFAVHYQGARPIPIDSEPDTWNIDPNLIEAKITPKTKAIMVVHIYGHPVDMDPILAIAKKHNLYVIEDCAEAHGTEYKGRKVGSLGDIGCFSFYANKIITTGEGGMITTNNKELAERARMLKALAFGKENKFMHQEIGFNYRLTNLQAALGLAQLKKIDFIIQKKRELASFYLKELADVEQLQLPVEKPYAKNVYWMFNVILRGSAHGKRSAVLKELLRQGIEVREDFIPYNMQDIFIKKGLAKPEDCPVANNLGLNGFYIPSGPILTDEEKSYVVRTLKAVLQSLS
ncbi:MAG: DegT/DnrJ/EryC1/StrS aminotransferase family protein [Patescibacteria group bacterium]